MKRPLLLACLWALLNGCASPEARFLRESGAQSYRTISGQELRVERDGTVLDVTCAPGQSEALCAGEKAVVLGRAERRGDDAWDMAPYSVAPETGCKPLLRYLTLETVKESRHSCWNRIWEAPAALVLYPVVTVALIAAITSPVWVPLIVLAP